MIKLLKKMIKWLKKLKCIVADYDNELLAAHQRIGQLEKLLRDRTDIAVDFHYKGMNYVIVVGDYKGVDYVQSFSLPASDVVDVIERLRNMERYGRVRRVDAPPSFRGVFQDNFEL